jgi:hypothetical protein
MQVILCTHGLVVEEASEEDRSGDRSGDAIQAVWDSETFSGEWISGSSVSAAGGCYAKSIQMYVLSDEEKAQQQKKIAVPAPLFDSFSQSPQHPFEVKKDCEVLTIEERLTEMPTLTDCDAPLSLTAMHHSHSYCVLGAVDRDFVSARHQMAGKVAHFHCTAIS